MNQQPAPLLTDQVSQEVLLHLFANESKPPEITPLDLALTSYLISQRAFDREIRDSQYTLASRLNTDYRAIGRSLKRLEKVKWIVCRGRGRCRSKGISLDLDRLPAAQPVREKISPDAVRLVDFYLELKTRASKKLPIIQGGKLMAPKLKLPRNWKQQQTTSAQRFLTEYGSYEKACQVVQALFHHEQPGIKAKARQSLYHAFNVSLKRARRLQDQTKSLELLREIDDATAARHVGNEASEGEMGRTA